MTLTDDNSSCICKKFTTIYKNYLLPSIKFLPIYLSTSWIHRVY